MIKINLLDSVTERARGAAVVEEKVTNPRARMFLTLASVGALMLLGMAFDYYSAGAALTRAQADLQREQQVAAQMAAINKEQAELSKKIAAIESRIEAIKKLRAAQQGPVALLSAINERLPAAPEFRLEAIEQKNGELTVEGNSPNEYAVTQFGRSLEFSSGLFQNVNIETERKPLAINPADYGPAEGPAEPGYRPETVSFKIKCKYGLPAEPQKPAAAPAPSAASGPPADQVAQR